jgi:hypothetical protein
VGLVVGDGGVLRALHRQCHHYSGEGRRGATGVEGGEGRMRGGTGPGPEGAGRCQPVCGGGAQLGGGKYLGGGRWGRVWNYGYMALDARFACCSGMQPGARQVCNTDGRGWKRSGGEPAGAGSQRRLCVVCHR